MNCFHNGRGRASSTHHPTEQNREHAIAATAQRSHTGGTRNPRASIAITAQHGHNALQPRREAPMDHTDELWTQIRRVLPTPRRSRRRWRPSSSEPLDDVRLSVLIGTIALNGQLGTGGLRPPRRSRLSSTGSSRCRDAAAGSSSRSGLARGPSCRGAGAQRQGIARPRDDRCDPACVGGGGGANRPPDGRPPAPLRGDSTPDLEHCVAAMQAGRLDPRTPRGLRPLSPPLERAHFARSHRWLPDSRTRHPRPRCSGPSGCAAGASRRGYRRRLERGPIAAPGGATRPEPRPDIPVGGDTADPRDEGARRPLGWATRRTSTCSRDGLATCSGQLHLAPRASARESDCHPPCRSWGGSPSLLVTGWAGLRARADRP